MTEITLDAYKAMVGQEVGVSSWFDRARCAAEHESQQHGREEEVIRSVHRLFRSSEFTPISRSSSSRRSRP